MLEWKKERLGNAVEEVEERMAREDKHNWLWGWRRGRWPEHTVMMEHRITLSVPCFALINHLIFFFLWREVSVSFLLLVWFLFEPHLSWSSAALPYPPSSSFRISTHLLIVVVKSISLIVWTLMKTTMCYGSREGSPSPESSKVLQVIHLQVLPSSWTPTLYLGVDLDIVGIMFQLKGRSLHTLVVCECLCVPAQVLCFNPVKPNTLNI